jgi:hypothetical protein
VIAVIAVVLSNGDKAEAEDPESAVCAARTIFDEAVDHGAASRLLTVSFYVDDVLVREAVRRADLRGA